MKASPSVKNAFKLVDFIVNVEVQSEQAFNGLDQPSRNILTEGIKQPKDAAEDLLPPARKCERNGKKQVCLGH